MVEWILLRLSAGMTVGTVSIAILRGIDVARGALGTDLATTNDATLAVIVLAAIYGALLGGLPATLVLMTVLHRFEPFRVVVPLASGAIVAFVLVDIVAPALGWIAEVPVLSPEFYGITVAGGFIAAVILLVGRRIYGAGRISL